MNELTPEQFNALLERLGKAAAILPLMDEAVRKKYPDGSYERIAFQKLKDVAPKLQRIRERMATERDTRKLTAEERATIHEVAVTLQNVQAMLQEIDFNIDV